MAFVQQKLGADAGIGGTSPTATFSSTVGVGNTVVACVVFDQSDGTVGDTVTLTDDKSNTYTQLDFIDDPNITQHFQVASFVSLGVTNGPITLTATITSSAPAQVEFAQVLAAEYSNVRAVDKHAGQNQRTPGTGTDAVTSGTVTTTTSGNTLVGFSFNTVSGTAVTAGTNYTSREHDTGGLDWEASLEDRLAGAPGSVAATFTDATNGGGATNDYTTMLIALSPSVFAVTDAAQFPVRGRQDYRMLAALSKVDEQWPFTATPNPKIKGFDWDPQFPIRTWHRFRDADEQWPFTAVLTKGPIEWDWRPEFARRRFIPSRSADEEWPFTATVTPAQFGWQLDPQFPTRRRFHPSRSADEQWPFTAVPTPTQFGWQLDPQFPWRLRWRTFQSSDDEFPFTATLTPSQMGWPFEPSFPFRVRWQRVRRDEDVTAVPVAAAPTWGLDDTILPSRRRFDPIQSQDDQYLFTAAVTPGQFGWDNPEHFPLRRRLPPLTVQDEQWSFTEVVTPAQFGWDNPEKFPLRVRFRPILSSDEEYPFTAAVTPTQFGWQIEPFFPSRLKFRPLVPAEQLLAPIAGTSTPTNIDFAYPPEFYTERRRYQPLVYEFWQPDIPPVSPTFQVMTGLAVKTKARTGATYITVTLQGTGIFMFAQQPTPTIFNEVLPFGSAHIVLTSGSMPVSVALGISNDGVNFTQLGPAVSQFPNILNLTPTIGLLQPGAMPYKYHAWIVTGGDISTQLTITELFVGWRA